MSTPIHGANGTATSSRSSSAVAVNQKERINGWTCPWHPLQFIAWFFIIFFACSYFGVHVFYLPVEWRAAGFIIPGGLLLIHIIYHLLALTIDPADRNIRGGPRRGKAIFDRTQHQHVIEDFHCYICQADVGAKSKHCSVCNKCVSDFDHHCKWLNNCVGGRNYRLFIGCISSAFALAVMVFTITLYIIVMFSVRKEDLSSLTESKSFEILKQVVGDTAFIVFTGIVGALLLLTIALLGHLLGFHIYLMCLKMSTYDFIVNSRDRRTDNIDVEAGHNKSPPSRKLFKNKVSPEVDRERESSHQERIELTDNARSEGSEETIPNEPTVKIISEVSSKAAAKQSRPSFESRVVDIPTSRSPAVANYSPGGITEPSSSEESLKEIVCTTPRVAIQAPFDFSQASTSTHSQYKRNQHGGETSSPRPGTSRERSDDDGEELMPSPRGKKPKKGGKSKRVGVEIEDKKDVLFESNGKTNAKNFATMKKSKKYATEHLPPVKMPNRGRPLPVLEPENS